jgi:hypothetical protein
MGRVKDAKVRRRVGGSVGRSERRGVAASGLSANYEAKRQGIRPECKYIHLEVRKWFPNDKKKFKLSATVILV